MALAGEVRAAMERLKPQERRVVGLLALGYRYLGIMELTGWAYTKLSGVSESGRGHALAWHRPATGRPSAWS